MKDKKKVDKRIFRSLALLSQFGINMLVPTGLMLWLGIWLDGKLGTSWLVIPCFFVGAVAGFQNIYKMAKGLMVSGKDDSKALEAGEEKE